MTASILTLKFWLWGVRDMHCTSYTKKTTQGYSTRVPCDNNGILGSSTRIPQSSRLSYPPNPISLLINGTRSTIEQGLIVDRLSIIEGVKTGVDCPFDPRD
jgi:hypothetical protein